MVIKLELFYYIKKEGCKSGIPYNKFSKEMYDINMRSYNVFQSWFHIKHLKQSFQVRLQRNCL